MALEEIDLSDAVEAVKSGGVIAFPTDTFYALGVDAMNGLAIERAFAIKRRPADTPMPVLVSHLSQIATFSNEFGKSPTTLAAMFWPGALTIVVDAAEEVPDVLTAGLGTVGLRMPDHKLAFELITQANCGITGTSANISGQPPSKDWRIVADQIGDELDAIVIGECGNASGASTVVRVDDGRATLLREGPIELDDINAVLEAQQ